MQKRQRRHRVVVGVCSSISAYKSVELVRRLVRSSCEVRVILTENAGRFITPLTFLGIGAEYVYTGLFNEEDNIGHSPHIFLLNWADALIVYPASANFIGKCANGIADDALTTFALAFWQRPIFIAPAMHNEMWQNPFLQKNLDALKTAARIIAPIRGQLADGTEAVGHIEAPEKAAGEVLSLLEKMPRCG